MSEDSACQTAASKRRLLVIEDDPSILLGLRINLEAEGYEVGLADDGRTGLDKALGGTWDVIILDVMLPHLNGFEVVRHLRSVGNDTPVLMLSAKSSETDKVMGLNLGAEDYITKPFGIYEVLARIKVALRRRRVASSPPPPVVVQSYSFGDVEVDVRTREVLRAGQPVELTATEFDVLEALLRAGGTAMKRQEIFERVWGPNHHGTPRTIDNFVAQLRQKLEPDPEHPRHLVTVRGIGYRFVG